MWIEYDGVGRRCNIEVGSEYQPFIGSLGAPLVRADVVRFGILNVEDISKLEAMSHHF